MTAVTTDEMEDSVVFITACVLLGAYMIALMICRCFDIRDSNQDVGLTIMADLKVNNETTQFYVITVVTGYNFWAGTTSSVSLIMYGSSGRSKTFTLKDRSNTVFLRGDIDSFLVSCDKDLGDLEKIRIWTDHSGMDPAWYCRKIMIRSVNPEQVWYFYINCWLTVTAEESTVIMEVPATTKKERKLFSVRFKENLLEQIDNFNLWFSIFRCSPASNFTRCQRLSCAFAELTGYLFIDIWFYGTPTEDEVGSSDIGEYTFDTFALVKGIEIVLLAMPVGIILVTLFRNIRSRYIPTLIIWENVVPATVQRHRNTIFIPTDLEDKSGVVKERKVKLPEEGTGPKVFEFESSTEDEDRLGLLLGNKINQKVHPNKLDQISKASTVSDFSIPSTDIPQLEGWIQDRVEEDDTNYPGVHSGAENDDQNHKKIGGHSKHPPPNTTNHYPFVHNVESKSAMGRETAHQDTITRLGRRAIIHSMRDHNPNSFIFPGDHDVHSVENMIDEQIREMQLRDRENKNDEGVAVITSAEEEMSKKETTMGEKTPWKKMVTTEYLKNIDHTLENEMKAKRFLHDKTNWNSRTALEMCRIKFVVNRRRCLSWPWWVIFIAWMVCLLTIVTCLIFTVLFGIHYGFLKSLKWLETLLYSFLISMFLIQPLNTLLFAFIFTLLGKRQKVKERLQVLIKDTYSEAPYLKSRLPYKFNLFKPIRIAEPLTGNAIFLLTIECRRKKEIRIKLIRLILCVLLLIPLIAVSYSGHNHYNYEVTRNVRDIFELDEKGGEKVKFLSADLLYEYLEDVVVHNLHPSRLYNGQSIPQTPNTPRLISDQQTLLIGVGRIRQQRVKPSQCLPPLGAKSIFARPTGNICYKSFKRITQDRGIYNPLWDPRNSTSNFSRSPTSLANDGWVFHNANSGKTQSLTFHGQQGIYDGGGYILMLGRNLLQSLRVVNYMKMTQWLDHRTRGIFIEVTLMNPNINKFVDAVILIEQGPTGAFSLTSWVSPIELIHIEDLKKSDEVAWISASIVAIILVLFVWICVFLYEQSNVSCGLCLRQYGFWFDVIIIIFVVASLCISFVRYVAAKELADLIEKQKDDEYLSIQSAAYWNDIQRAMFSVTQSLVFIMLWKLLMFTDKRFLTFALTLKLTGRYMMAFILVLAILLCAFATWGYFLFGQDLWEFSTWGESMISLTDQILEASSFERMITSNPILGPAFVFLFGYFIMFIGLNFAIALLDFGVHEAKEVVSQRRIWLTYSRYFRETLLKSFMFVNSVEKQQLSELALTQKSIVPSNTIHPDRWYGMKMATTAYIRSFLRASKAVKMKEMQLHCNTLLTGTGYRMISIKQKVLEKDQEKQQHIDQLRRMTSDYIQDKLGHDMKPKEFKEYADVNKKIVKLRIQKMEKTMEKLVQKFNDFMLRRSSHPSRLATQRN